jgi:hypothetical protein
VVACREGAEKELTSCLDSLQASLSEPELSGEVLDALAQWQATSEECTALRQELREQVGGDCYCCLHPSIKTCSLPAATVTSVSDCPDSSSGPLMSLGFIEGVSTTCRQLHPRVRTVHWAELWGCCTAILKTCCLGIIAHHHPGV